MIKKIMALFLVVLMSIESFAALVSDNDGAAFVTKGEFDALKQSFENQIDDYNTSIDEKIEGAIESYLMNIRLDKPVTYNVINHKWNEVVFINGSYANDYKTPDINYLVGLSGYSIRPTGTSTPVDIRSFDSNFLMSYRRPANQSNRKNCFVLLEGTEGNPTKLYWRGISKSYREVITCIIQNSEYCPIVYSAFCWSDRDYEKRLLCRYPFKCKNASYNLAYNTRIFDVSAEPQAKQLPSGSWYNARGSGTASSNWDRSLVKLNIELDTIDGSKYDTEHIIGWSKDTEWELYCPNWKNTWQLSNKQTLNDLSIYNAVTKTTKGWYAGQEVEGSTHRQAAGSMPFTFVNSTTTTPNKFYSVGLYNTNVKNSSIYQTDKDFQYTSTDTFNISNLTIEKGLPILAGKEEEKVEFKPIIKSIKCYNESGTYVTNQHEVDVYLSYVPFNEKNVSTDPVKIKQSDGTEKTYTTTSDRKADIKFDMDKTSVVYMQLMPHFDSTATVGPSKTWEIVLDLTGNGGTYVLISSIA